MTAAFSPSPSDQSCSHTLLLPDRDSQAEESSYKPAVCHMVCCLHLTARNIRKGAAADVSSEPPCGERRNVTGEMGGAVTLYTDYTGIRDITWVRDHNAIAVTQPGDVPDIINSSYRGRLSATHDGSLVITNLTREDQGYYMANILRASQCIQEYYLTVYDLDGISSTPCNVQMSSGWYDKDSAGSDYTTINLLRLTLSAFVLGLTCFIFTHHMKTGVIQQEDSGPQ
ncbi:uncharacterized protein [Dendropsophus ebraccatus]|uniref:uncharacterized protein n=1 Tax=Dendropsophus ebraccatus TaxID=150705 RepID=UPI003831746C